MADRLEAISTFQMITGASEAKSKQFLTSANWNVENAVTRWFESGEDASVDVGPIAAPSSQKAAAPAPVQYQPVEEPEPEIGTLPGLYNKKDNKLLPLKAIFVKAKIVDFVADVEITQKFVNDYDQALEAVFKFESHNATITNFEVEVNGKVVKGLCTEKHEAQDKYDDAVASGHGAYLVEKDKAEDVLKISIGNLPPKKSCILKIRYITELAADEEYLRFNLPATRTPIYKIGDDTGLAVAFDITMPSKIVDIKSPTHGVKTEIKGKTGMVKMRENQENGRELQLLIKLEDPHCPASFVEVFDAKSALALKDASPAKVEPSIQVAEKKSAPVDDLLRFGPQPGGHVDPFFLDFGPQPGMGLNQADDLAAFGPQPGSFFSIYDFPQPGSANIAITTEPEKQDQPSTMRESDKPHAVMLTLFPKIESDDDTICEIIFVVDRSGSMSGTRMNQAKNALQLFLRSLPPGSRFNIIGFGSSIERLFPSSREFNQQNLNAATTHVSNMQANLVGTEMLQPLREIFNNPVDPGYPRQIFLLTDGEDDKQDDILNLVKTSIGHLTRIFTFGIGAEASKALVRGIAKYGRGKPEFVVSGERMEPKIMKQLKRALQPILKNITVDWSSLPVDPKYDSIEVAYPPLFDGDRLILYNFIKGNQQFGDREVIVRAETGQQRFEWKVPVHMERDCIEGSHIHRLTASKFAKSLEKEGKTNRQQIVDIGTEWGLLTKYTSYVAVEERNYLDGSANRMISVDVNQELSKNRPKPQEKEQERNHRRRASNDIAYNYGVLPESDLAGCYGGFDDDIRDTDGTCSSASASGSCEEAAHSETGSGSGSSSAPASPRRKPAPKTKSQQEDKAPPRSAPAPAPASYSAPAWRSVDEDIISETNESIKGMVADMRGINEMQRQANYQMVQSTSLGSVPHGSKAMARVPSSSKKGLFGRSASKKSEKSAEPVLAKKSSNKKKDKDAKKARAIDQEMKATSRSDFAAPKFAPPEPLKAEEEPLDELLAMVREVEAIGQEINNSVCRQDEQISRINSAPRSSEALMTWGIKSSRAEAPRPNKPAAAPAVAKHSAMRGLDSFILLQGFDGSFSLSTQFCQETGFSSDLILGLIPNTLKQMSDIQSDQKELIWVTCIAIAYLSKTFAAEKEEWELIIEKSFKFIRRLLKDKADAVLEASRGFIQRN